MRKKKEQEEKFGILYRSQREIDVMAQMAKDGLIGEENPFFTRKERQDAEISDKGVTLYIVTPQKEVFKTCWQQLQGKAREGIEVVFQTPQKKTGKFRWAYDVRPVVE